MTGVKHWAAIAAIVLLPPIVLVAIGSTGSTGYKDPQRAAYLEVNAQTADTEEEAQEYLAELAELPKLDGFTAVFATGFRWIGLAAAASVGALIVYALGAFVWATTIEPGRMSRKARQTPPPAPGSYGSTGAGASPQRQGEPVSA